MNQEGLLAYYYGMAYKTNTPVSAVIELLTRCNVNCIHCYLPSHKDEGLSFSSVKQLIRELKEIGVSHILLTGGEIFLRNDIIDIVKLIRSLHMRVTLLSNATLLNEDIIKQLSELYITELSTTIFSMQGRIHDAIMQVDGSLEKALKNLQCLKKYQIRVKVKMPIFKQNANCIEEVRQYCAENNFEFYPSSVIFPQNDGNTKPVDLRLETEELCRVVKKIDEMNTFKESPVHQREVPCAAIFYSLSVDCQGNVYPCNSLMYKVGNIHQDSIMNIWQNSEKLRKIKEIKSSDLAECSGCEKKIFCERCPGMALLESGDMLGCDTYAKMVAQIRECKYSIR